MTQHTFYVIGIQLLFLSHAAQSFVLLTANMEDVKKIARKFVSDSLADKIAEFVVKATEQIINNVSQENNNNADELENESNDKYQSKIAREGEKKATRTTQDPDFNRVNEKSNNSFDEQHVTSTTHKERTSKDTTKTSDTYWEKELNGIPQSKKGYSQQLHMQSRKPKNSLNIENKKSYIKESVPLSSLEEHNESHSKKNSRYLSTFRPTIDSTHLYASKASLDDMPKLSPRHKRPVKRGHGVAGADSKEDSSDKSNNVMSPPSNVKRFDVQRSHFTTERVKNEFDQYDNPNYPKAEYIATSGPVALPKVQMQKPWWEKEFPGREHMKA